MLKLIIFVFFAVQFTFISEVTAFDERRTEGNLVIKGIPEEIPQYLIDRLNQYQNTRGHAFRSWAPDGGIFIGTRFGETSQIHHVKKPGAARRQLTFFEESTRGANINPNDNRNILLFSMDRGGDEHRQYYYFNLDDASWQMVTDGQSINRGARWDRNGDYFTIPVTEGQAATSIFTGLIPITPKKLKLYWK